MTKKPHVHAETIRAWADGESIQYRVAGGDRWVDCADPAWVADYVYRVKPAREYPVVSLNHTAMNSAFQKLVRTGYNGAEEFANSTLRHACDAGQVVTREEFKRVSDEANKAVRSLHTFGFTDHGGELWKPPLGPSFVIKASNG